MRWLEAERGLDFDGDYEALPGAGRSTQLDDFWASIWDASTSARRRPTSRCWPTARCPAPSGSPAPALNYAENLLAGKPADRLAVQHASELRELDSLTWGELREQVARTAVGPARARGRARRPRRRLHAEPPRGAGRLPRHGLDRRDLVDRARPTSAPRSVVDRFAQIEPKVLFCVDGYRYNGRDFDRMRGRRRAARATMPTRRAHVVLPYLDPEADARRPRAARSAWASCSNSRRPRRDRLRAACPSTTRSGSSTPRAPPGCRRRSSRATAGSCSSS